MNVYVVTICFPYGLYICIVSAKDDINALNLSLSKFYKENSKTNPSEVDSYIKELPVISKNDVEEVLYFNSYEE